MATTNFTAGTVIESSWLNDVDSFVYDGVVKYVASGGDDTVGLQAAINTGKHVYVSGTCYANNLVVTTNGQTIEGLGQAQIIKNANGPLITFSGNEQTCIGIEFRGDASTPTYTGANVVSTGRSFGFHRCGSRWAYGAALILQGANPLVLGQRDIIQSSLHTYDIECGLNGTARLYGRIQGIYTSQSSGGIYMVDTGAWSIVGSQFGKLFVESGSGGLLAGTNGGMFSCNRILGDITIGISNSVFSGNAVSDVTVTFVSGTSGHVFDESNTLSNNAVVVDDSSSPGRVMDGRQIPLQLYTPSWTGASSNPSLGDGTLVGYYSRTGRMVTVSLRLLMGSTTSFGSGQWYFSLPFTPSPNTPFTGTAKLFDSGTVILTGVVETLLDSSGRCQITADNTVTAIGSAVPFTWATGDQISFSLTYWV